MDVQDLLDIDKFTYSPLESFPLNVENKGHKKDQIQSSIENEELEQIVEIIADHFEMKPPVSHFEKDDTIWFTNSKNKQVEWNYSISSNNYNMLVKCEKASFVVKKTSYYQFIYYRMGNEYGYYIKFTPSSKLDFFHGHFSSEQIYQLFKPFKMKIQINQNPIDEWYSIKSKFQGTHVQYSTLEFGNYKLVPSYSNGMLKIMVFYFEHIQKIVYLPSFTSAFLLQEDKFAHDSKQATIIFMDKKISLFTPFEITGAKKNDYFVESYFEFTEKDMHSLIFMNEFLCMAIQQNIYNSQQVIQWVSEKLNHYQLPIPDHLENLLCFCLWCYYFHNLNAESFPNFKWDEWNQLIKWYKKYKLVLSNYNSKKEYQIYKMCKVSQKIVLHFKNVFYHPQGFQHLLDHIPKEWIKEKKYNLFDYNQLHSLMYHIYKWTHSDNRIVIHDTLLGYENEEPRAVMASELMDCTYDEICDYLRFKHFYFTFEEKKCNRLSTWIISCGNAEFKAEKQVSSDGTTESFSKETISPNSYEYHKIDNSGKNEHLIITEKSVNSSMDGFDAYKLCKTTPNRDMNHGKMCLVVGRVPSHALVACNNQMSKIRVSEFIPKDIIELDIEVKGNETEGYEFEVKSKENVLLKDITLDGMCPYCVVNPSTQYAKPCNHEIGCLQCTIHLYQKHGANCPYCTLPILGVEMVDPKQGQKKKTELIHHEKAYSFVWDSIQEYQKGVPVVVKDFDPHLSTLCTNGIHCHKNLNDIYQWIPYGMIPSSLVYETIFNPTSEVSDQCIENWTQDLLIPQNSNDKKDEQTTE